MIVTETEPALHWTCPVCELEWLDSGSGFPGHRYSECLGCGTHALEIADARPATGRPAPHMHGRRFAPPG